LFGDANWWFPRWLDRALPKLSVDADDLATRAPDEGSETQRELAESVRP